VSFLMDISRLTEYFFSKCRLFVFRSFFYHFFHSFLTANIFFFISDIYRLCMCAFELSFPFILPFISPRAINPFLLLTRTSVTTRLINFRSRSPVFFLSPPFWLATLDCSWSIPPPGASFIFHVYRVASSSRLMNRF